MGSYDWILFAAIFGPTGVVGYYLRHPIKMTLLNLTLMVNGFPKHERKPIILLYATNVASNVAKRQWHRVESADAGAAPNAPPHLETVAPPSAATGEDDSAA